MTWPLIPVHKSRLDHKKSTFQDIITVLMNIFNYNLTMLLFIMTSKIWLKVHILHTVIFLICDMIKRNESDVGNVVFEILAKTVFKFLCFILFLALSNSS